MALNRITQFVLERRGITPEYLEEIEDGNYSGLNEMDRLCRQLHGIKQRSEQVVIVPDFDMDGIMSGICGYAGLSALGLSCRLFRPNVDKYGISAKDIDALLEDFPAAKAIVTCDTGIGCKDAIRHAKECGLIVLVTDHHKEIEESSPRGIADAIVDPCAIGETYEHPAICGAFVMWQVVDSYARMFGKDDENLKNAVDLLRVFAGIGTVSDTMPVLYENRKLIKDAVRISRECLLADEAFKSKLIGMPEEIVNAMRGLYSVLSYLKSSNKLADADRINEDTFGFYIAPMFNSIKRMGADIGTAFDIFIGKDRRANIAFLGDLNEQRKNEVQKAFDAILAAENDFAPFVYICQDKPGLLGLLATKLLALSGLPTLVLSQDASGQYSGSGRSPEWFPLVTLSEEIDGLTCRGHEGSFGCHISSDAALESICDAISKKVAECKPDGDLLEAGRIDISFSTQDDADFILDQEELLEFADNLESLRPFGRDFERPTVMARFEGADSKAKRIGSDSSHLKMNVNDVDVICWGQGDRCLDCLESDAVEVIGDVSINEFRGTRKAQIIGSLVSLQVGGRKERRP